MAKEKAALIDKQVGANIRRIRERVGMSQEALGKSVPITFQQAQKYEKGTNRVAASTLLIFANHMGCSVLDFFEGVVVGSSNSVPPLSKDARQVAEKFEGIGSLSIRNKLKNLVDAIATEGASI